MRSNTTSKISRIALLSSICFAGLGFAGVAQAQTATAAAEPAQETEVVIVTATKRETTLQSIPVAVSVTSADTISKAQVRDLNDIQTLVPSLRVSTNQSSTNATFIIRGFGNGANNAGIEPSVAIFIDGVYRSRAGASIGDLPNLQRVEVLRGPQSTLFGKNASAGVISLVTREPKFEYGGSAELSYGNFNAIVAKADITGPLGENAAGALSFGYNKRDGYVENIGLGVDINNRDRFNVRADLLIKPSDDLKVRVIADYDKLDELCCAVSNVLSGPATAAVNFAGGQLIPNSPFADRVYSDIPPTNLIENRGVSMQVDYDFGKLSFTSISAYRNSHGEQDGDVDFTSASLASVPQIQDIDTLTQEFRLTSNYDGRVNFLLGAYLFKENIDQTSAVVYGKDFRKFAIAAAGAGGALIPTIEVVTGNAPGSFFGAGTGTKESFSLDNDAQSIFGNVDFKLTDTLTFTAGFNYTRDSKAANINVLATDPFAFVDFDALGQGAFGRSVYVGGATNAFLGLAVLGLGRPATAAEAAAASAGQIAAAQSIAAATFDANPAANNPILGFKALQFQPPRLNSPNAVESGRTKDSGTSYNARLAWEINDNFNAYASYATGFKASSVNLSRDSAPSIADFIPGNPITNPAPSKIRSAGLAVVNLRAGSRAAGPEEATVYEIGLKARFPKGAFNLTLFDQSIDGFQSNTFTGTGFILANAGKQSTKGVEFDATYRPIRPLILTYAATYLDPLYDDFKGGAYGDYTGRTPAGIAEFTYNASATFIQPLANDNRITYRADYFWTSETQLSQGLNLNPASAFPNTPAGVAARNAANLKAAEPYTFQPISLNASITFATSNGWELSAWSRNLTDERYLTTIFDSVAQDGSISGYPSPPRTYGVSVKHIW
ncbi:MAG: TonB-dependent receptor [Hyphomonadaceae bacterium]